MLSPYAYTFLLVDGNLIITYQAKERFDKDRETRCKIYSSYSAAIIAKYLMRPRDGINKIIMVWVDSDRDIREFDTYPGTKEYRTYLSTF